MNCYEVLSTNLLEVIVVGGGTCGLAVTSRLCEDSPGSIYTEDEHQRFHWLKQRGSKVNLINRNVSSKKNYKLPSLFSAYKPSKKYSPHEILVLDATSDNWLGQWDHQFATCSIPYLRSPMFFHPDPVNVDGLVSFAYLTRREGSRDLMEIDNVVGKEYSKHKQKKLRMKNNKRKSQPVPTNSQLPSPSSQNSPGLIDINMRDWKDYYRPSTSLFRDFCQDIIDRYKLHNMVKKDKVVDIEYCLLNVTDTNECGKGFLVRTEGGQIFGCKSCVVTTGHAGKINYPISPFKLSPEAPEGSCHTTHIFQRKVSSFPDANIIHKIEQGKRNSMVVVGGGLTSAQLVDVALRSGVEKCYLLLRGGMKIKHFDFHLDWVTKYKNVKKSAFYMLDSDEERFQMIQDAREGGSLNPEYYKKIMNHVKSGKLELLRFTTIDEQDWIAAEKCWKLKLKCVPNKNNSRITGNSAEFRTLTNVDYIYFATGITPDLEGLGFMDNIIQHFPIDIIHGLPVLTDNLQWNNEIPLFMTGKNAQLKMGPSSANLDGARLGAERVGWCLQEMRSQGSFDWVTSSYTSRDETCSIHDCPVCEYSDSDLSSISSMNSNEISSNTTSSEVSKEVTKKEKPFSAFEARLKLAGGELNWYSLLETE
ncbi:hypothetical protein CLIB1423_04S04632 [[Candida] railenensis]|uniref:L-ornithine N(5)-monooxygenase n=1 Tax=[Candida] railenensis TaxID=45579 RepID=A0A9P0QNJ2_9ASCO|nr:hypothetical protein CLIB1423_04S04632 [[Candida] railenensis]